MIRTLATVAAVAVLVTCSPSTTDPSSAPDRGSTPTAEPTPSGPPLLADLPAGDPPRIAYLERRTLVLPDGANVRVPPAAYVVQRAGVVLVSDVVEHPSTGDVYDPASIRIQLVRDGELEVLTTEAEGPAVISPDGATVAWAETGADDRAYVVGWDVATGARLPGRAQFDFVPSCCDNPFMLESLDLEGRVVAAGGGTRWRAPLDGSTSPVVVKGRSPMPGQQTTSPDGRHRAVVAGTTVVLREVGKDQRETLVEFGEEPFDLVGWEDDESFLAELARHGRGPDAPRWVRCRTDGSCETVAAR